MTAVSFRTNLEELKRDFGAMQKTQAPYAQRWAADATLKDAEQAVRNRIQQTFRASPQGMRFLLNHVKVFSRASTMARALGSGGVAGIGIIPPQGKGSLAGWSRYRGSLLPMMEEGGATPGPKRFGGGGQGGTSDLGRYAIPVRRYTDRTPIPLGLHPINLGLASRMGIDGRTVGGGLRGKRRTYMLPMLNSPGNAMIFQRFGRGKGSDSMPIFWTQRDTRLPARRFFFSTVKSVVATRMGYHFQRAMAQALFGRGRYGTAVRA